MGIKRQSPGKWQVFSETGVGDGYKLHTYTPGTTDNKVTHTNKAGSADNTNPVVFDARGEADIWFNGEYDLKLVDADDALIWTLSDFGAGEETVNYGNFNKVKDGGFEDDTDGDTLPDQWTTTAYPTAGSGAGVVVIDTSDQIEGANSLKFTSVGDGGGYTLSSFFEVAEGVIVAASWQTKSTVAGVRNLVEIVWYTAAQVLVSASSIFDDSTTNPTAWTQKTGSATAPSTARYAKLRMYGCHSSDATSGSTWFDDVKVLADAVQGDLTVINNLTVNNDASITGGMKVGGNTALGDTTITPDNELHAHRATAGVIASHANAISTIENNAAAYQQFLTPNTVRAGHLYGDPESATVGAFQYDHANNYFVWDVGVGAKLYLGTGLYSPNATGGDKGADTANFSGVYDDGVQISPSSSFRAHKNGTNQTNITGTQKVTFGTEAFDTNSDFASDRHTPTIAGKYLYSAQIFWDPASVTTGDTIFVYIYKNGTLDTSSRDYWNGESHAVTAIIDMNGSTDYVEVFANNVNRDTSDIDGTAAITKFEGFLV